MQADPAALTLPSFFFPASIRDQESPSAAFLLSLNLSCIPTPLLPSLRRPSPSQSPSSSPATTQPDPSLQPKSAPCNLHCRQSLPPLADSFLSSAISCKAAAPTVNLVLDFFPIFGVPPDNFAGTLQSRSTDQSPYSTWFPRRASSPSSSILGVVDRPSFQALLPAIPAYPVSTDSTIAPFNSGHGGFKQFRSSQLRS